MDVTHSEVAYGDRALGKINRELGDADLLTQQRALFSLCDLVRNPQNIQQAIDNGVIVSLRGLLAHSDDTVRIKTTEVFLHISGHALGRTAIARENCLVPLAARFDDTVLKVRLNAHTALERSTQVPASGAEILVQSQVVPALIAKIDTDEDEIKAIALDILHHIMRVDVLAALNANAMTVLIKLLGSKVPLIAERSARNIMALSFAAEGKVSAVDNGAVPALVALLSPANTTADTRSAAAGALMSITITREGKDAAVAVNAPAALVALLTDPDDSVKVNTIKAITTLSEHPEARKQFLPSVSILEQLKTNTCAGRDHDVIKRFATQAIATITWKP